MADIKDQLIKDSYNYVLQSDVSTGVVYRIGGSIPVNPIFSSGLTINSGFTYSNGTERNGYVLTTDGTGYAYWSSASAATPSSGVTSITVGTGLSANSSTGAVTIVFTGSTGTSGTYLPLSGGTVTGGTIFQSGVTANTIYTSSKLSVGSLPQNLSAIIEVASTTQGILFPRMTNAQRESIVSPTPGLFVFCTDFPDGLFMYKSTGWLQIL
jgi:hypothetical protein